MENNVNQPKKRTEKISLNSHSDNVLSVYAQRLREQVEYQSRCQEIRISAERILREYGEKTQIDTPDGIKTLWKTPPVAFSHRNFFKGALEISQDADQSEETYQPKENIIIAFSGSIIESDINLTVTDAPLFIIKEKNIDSTFALPQAMDKINSAKSLLNNMEKAFPSKPSTTT